MKKIDLYNVLISPVITEKSNNLAEKHGQVVFKVQKHATKLDIALAFKLVFGSDVSSVTVLNVKGKTKRFGRSTGRRANWKKAYIQLVDGQDFNLASIQN